MTKRFMISCKLMEEWLNEEISLAMVERDRSRCHCGCEDDSKTFAEGQIVALRSVLVKLYEE